MGYRFNIFSGKLDQTDKSVVEQSITNSTVITGLQDGSGWNLPGPYTNEAGAAEAGVAIGQAYYDNGGTVRVRLT
jgi:hypothetical protein